MSKFISDISKKEFPESEKISAFTIRNSVLNLIRKDYPSFNENSNLSSGELNVYRQKYIEEYLKKEVGDINDLEMQVLEKLKSNETITDKLEDEIIKLTLGQKLSDRVASFGGSWKFILIFLFLMLCWIIINTVWLSEKSFDPYPFILLNLLLSCVAALQAPIIMMSQNRQEEKDRDRSKKDYMINLKSELEIRLLHEKLDHLIFHQQQELFEIQQIQMETMNDILLKIEKHK
jgi:uncharacterized membrane protein